MALDDMSIGASSDNAVGITESVETVVETSVKGVSLVEVNGQESIDDDPALVTCSEAVPGHVEVAQNMCKSLVVESCCQAVLEKTCDIKHTAEIEKSVEKKISLEESNNVQESTMKSDVPEVVTCQFAMEVEKETVDYKEVGNVPSLNSPDVMNMKEDSPANDTSSMLEDSAASAETHAERTNVTPDVELSQVIETAQAEVNNSEKEVISCFDLNQEVFSEEVFSEDMNDHPSNQFSTPVSTVSAPELPAAPLQYEGSFEWKGLASTSAFPHKSSSSGSSSKQQVCLDIDLNLNVTENFDGESCLDTNSRKYEHLELDLNHASEDDGPSDWQIGQLFPYGNCHQSRSHSSSSSVKQPSLMNFDLNGQPSFLNDSSNLSKLSQNHNVSEVLKSDESVISIMGTRVQVNRKDVASHVHPLLNGQKQELACDLNLGRSGNNVLRIGSVPYTPFYGYNSIGSGSEHAHVFSPALYGSGAPIPYMMDSRGAPVIHQLMGSVSALPTAYAQPPSIGNMNSSSSSNGVPSGSSYNQNCGTMGESGSREPVGFRQFLSTGQMGPMDEQMSSAGGKRKVSETEWVNYPPRQYMPHWK